MPDPKSLLELQRDEFTQLIEQRDVAAYYCVNTIQFCLAFFEAQEFEKARKQLQHALDLHKKADDQITAFHVRHAENLKKEVQSSGRTPDQSRIA